MAKDACPFFHSRFSEKEKGAGTFLIMNCVKMPVPFSLGLGFPSCHPSNRNVETQGKFWYVMELPSFGTLGANF